MFVAHCILNQYARAIGVRAKTDALVVPLLKFLVYKNCAIVQMPCPEIEYEGLVRVASGRRKYDTPEYRVICRRIAEKVVNLIEEYQKMGFKIVVLGVDGSPSCGVNFWGRRWIREKGIFIEELEFIMRSRNIHVPLIGVNIMRVYETIKELSGVLV